MYKHFFKRVISLFLAICGLVVCAIPMVIIAIAIKCDSKGPIIFKQRRLGKGMKPFKRKVQEISSIRDMLKKTAEVMGK